MSENVNLIIQIIAAGGVIVSVVYLAIQINQQNKITRAQFGYTLTQRQYDRYFASSRDGEFSEFLSKDWSGDLDDKDRVRVTMFLITTLVDIFDVYDKVKSNFVDEKHLITRMNALKLGTFKTPLARTVWDFWKISRDQEFIDWFELEIYGENSSIDYEKNPNNYTGFSKSIR